MIICNHRLKQKKDVWTKDKDALLTENCVSLTKSHLRSKKL